MLRRAVARSWLRSSPLTPRHPSNLAARSKSTQASRVDRVTSRLPRFLQKYTTRLRDAPVSHVVSFLILHELTAIVPLFGLFGIFHYTDFVPTTYVTTHCGRYVERGIVRFEKYFSRKQWFGFGGEGEQLEAESPPVDKAERAAHAADVMRRSEVDDKYRILVEVALAYAITKALLPVRIIGSVWATPWCARILIRARGALRR